MEQVPYLGQSLTRWCVGNSTFLAMPEKGARLMNWNLAHGDGSVRDILYWPELQSLDDFHLVRGGNPILFPFCARTFDRGEIHCWRGADDIRRPMPMHGYARQGNFKVTHLDRRGFTALFLPDDDARAGYPYDYEFTVTYRFSPLSLACEFALTNLGREPLPWCAGHHFYFTLPWNEGLQRSDYLIRIPATKTLRQNPTGQLEPGPQLPAEISLADPALLDTFHTGLSGNPAVFGERGHAGDIAIRIGAGKRPPPDSTIVTWTKADDSPFFCVEPWMGPPNAPETKTGLHHVEPGKSEKFAVEVSVQ